VATEQELKRLAQEAKRQMFKDQGGLCWLCDTPMILTKKDVDLAATFDHLVALRNGGTWELTNLKLAHRFCNSRRGHAPITRISPPYVPTEADKRSLPFSGRWLRAHGYMK
jgi:5-methylcytosine-specific restriction endonuclease McrA